MMLRLIRYDRVWRGAASWLPGSLLTATLLLGSVTWLAVSSGGEERMLAPWAGAVPTPLASLLFLCGTWATVALFLVFKAASGRYGRFSLTLPIPAPQLWLTHLLATLAAGTLMIATIQLVGGLAFLLLARSEGVDGALLLGLSRNASLLMLGLGVAALSLQSHRMHQAELRSYRWRASGIMLLILVSLVLLGFVSSLLTNLLWIPLIAWGLSRWRSVPNSFVIAPDEIDDSAGHSAATADGAWAPVASTSGLGYRLFQMRVIYGTISKNFALYLLTLPFLVLFGSTFAGALSLMERDSSMRFGFIILTSYSLIAFTAGLMHKLAHIDMLPISRRHLFAIIVLPGALMVVLGYGLGTLSVGRWLPAVEEVHFVEESDNRCGSQRVPGSILDIAWKGGNPVVTAPWGESHPSWTTPLYEGLKPILVSRYTTPAGCSMDYFAWQMSRAAEAAYGERIPPAELKARYLSVNELGNVVFKSGPPELRRDYPELRPDFQGHYFPVIMFIVALFWFVPTALFLRVLRFKQSDRHGKVVMFTAMGIVMLIHLAQYVPLMMNDMTDFGIFTLWSHVVLGLPHVLPGGALTLWIISGLAIGLLYKLSERQFVRHEMLSAPAGKCSG